MIPSNEHPDFLIKPLSQCTRKVYCASIRQPWNVKWHLDEFIAKYTPHCIWTRPYAPTRDKQPSSLQSCHWQSKWLFPFGGRAKLLVYPEALGNDATILLLCIRTLGLDGDAEVIKQELITYVIPQTVIRDSTESNPGKHCYQVLDALTIGKYLGEDAIPLGESLGTVTPGSKEWHYFHDELRTFHAEGLLKVLNRPFTGRVIIQKLYCDMLTERNRASSTQSVWRIHEPTSSPVHTKASSRTCLCIRYQHGPMGF